MKKSYESAELSIVMFNSVDVIVASEADVPTSSTQKPSYSREDNEMEIL